jgi:hypothetical protein
VQRRPRRGRYLLLVPCLLRITTYSPPAARQGAHQALDETLAISDPNATITAAKLMMVNQPPLPTACARIPYTLYFLHPTAQARHPEP